MERIKALINKLHEQSEENANSSELMSTVQMIHAALTQFSAPAPRQMSTSKVSVTLPSSNRVSFSTREITPEVKETTYKETIPQAIKQPEYKEQSKIAVAEPVKKETERTIHQVEVKRNDQPGWLFDQVEEIPTLAHQKEFRERNDIFNSNNGSSLNDRLKTEKKELASLLTEGSVRDLKKAIGINDRFVFLSELFRGDETMYERSLKTINNFRIYPEAEYWIERELKVKLGWDENKEAVKHFRQLVKRRFM